MKEGKLEDYAKTGGKMEECKVFMPQWMLTLCGWLYNVHGAQCEAMQAIDFASEDGQHQQTFTSITNCQLVNHLTVDRSC